MLLAFTRALHMMASWQIAFPWDLEASCSEYLLIDMHYLLPLCSKAMCNVTVNNFKFVVV